MGGQRHSPAALPPGKTRYPLYRRLDGPQGRSGQVRKISTPPPGFDPRTVQLEGQCSIVLGDIFHCSNYSINWRHACDFESVGRNAQEESPPVLPTDFMLHGLNGPRFETGWARDFSRPSRPALGPTLPSIQWVGHSQGEKRPGAWH